MNYTQRVQASARAVMVGLALVLIAALGPGGTAGAQSRATLVRFPFPQDDGSLTPYTFELGHSLLMLVYDSLLWRDDKGVPQPWLAQSVQSSPDGRRVSARLVQGARWHDGAAITSADVVFTFTFMAQHHHPRFTPQLRAIAGVEAPAPDTVVFNLRYPSPGFNDQPLSDVPILPAHIWQRLPRDRPIQAGLPIGSGPYRLTEYNPGRAYRFQANQQYFRGPPAVDTLEVPFITDAEQMFRAFERRQVDMIPVSLPREAVERLGGLAIRVGKGPQYLGTVLAFNLRRPPFDRLEARQAVTSALDLERMANQVGDAIPADRGLLHPDSPWASTEVLHRFDEAAARARLTAAGLPPVDVVAPDTDPLKMDVGRRVALALQRLGFQATARNLPRAEFRRVMGEDGSVPSFQLAISVVPPLASYDPDYLRRLFSSDPRDGNSNFSGYRNPAFDRLADRIAATPDPAARRTAVTEELRLLANEVPVFPILFAQGNYTYRPSIYDGWIFIKGSGILDKRSFIEPSPGRSRPPPIGQPIRPDGSGSRLPLMLLALAVLVAAGVLAVVAYNRRRRSASF